MGEQLVIAGADPGLDLSRPARESPWLTAYLDAADAAWRRARERVRNPSARATERAYYAAWRLWGDHCSARSWEPMPLTPARLVGYLELLGERLAPNTVRLHLAALSSLDQAWRLSHGEARPLSLRNHVVVQRWLRSWSREHPRAARRQAAALSPDDLERLLICAQERRGNVSPAAHIAQYARDRCLILLAVLGARRISEMVALELADLERGDRGIKLRIRRSKTDQQGRGLHVAIMPQARTIRCGVEALAQWLRVRGEADGPLFVSIARDGRLTGQRLSVRQAQAVIDQRARAAGLVGVSSHSCRRTFATLAGERGKPLHKIMAQGDWASATTALGYIEQGDLFNDNPTLGLLE